MAQSITQSDTSRPRRQATAPDVPEAVDDWVMAHFNDPNWNFEVNFSTLSISTNGVEHRRRGCFFLTDFIASVYRLCFTGDSPYPEVRAAVANTDDPTMPVNTFRVWFLGVVFALVIPAFNSIITLRYPYILISLLFVQLITLPLGKFLEWILPKYRISAFGYSCFLNPGPFNIKEHTLISVMVTIIVDGTGIQFTLAISAQLLGFSFAGIFCRFLVWPANMIWPGVLVRCALLNAMHSNYGKKESKYISKRKRFLYLSCLCSFLWCWFPGYLWTGLRMFTWVCWIAPNHVVVNSLFGGVSGLGMSGISFDWSMISQLGSPLVVPWWAQLNSMAGFVIVIWFICPIMWAKNVFYSQYIPISTGLPYDNTGAQYNLSAIVTNGQIDQTKYEQYSPLFLPITYAVSYGTIFASYSSVLVHTFLWYRHVLVRQFRHGLEDGTDIHAHLMGKYAEVPHWWFIALGVFSFALGVVGIEVCQVGLPIWAFIVSILLAILFIIPCGIIQAITNQQIDPVVLAELFIGYVSPGRPLATMVFKMTAGGAVSQALSYSSDLKFGHYMKIPPRIMFSAQIISASVSIVSSILARQWALDNIPDVCSRGQKNFFTCPNLEIYNTSSILWGGIGPKRLFSSGTTYYSLIWFFAIGVVLPIPFYYLARRYPRSFWRYVIIPVVLNSPGNVPPANGIMFMSSLIVGFIFQWFMRRFHFRWWLRYNYLLATGLDAGTIIGLIVIFSSVQLPKGGFNVNWWGNRVWQNTADAKMVPLKSLAPGQTFGPSKWS
ncbi:OPT oligopeptide transporter [Russula compacta]|nr:OPT oligopeptide transporter [Russula compacta]